MLRRNIGTKLEISLQWELADKNFSYKGLLPTNHSSFHKTRLNDGLKKLDRSFFSFVTSHAFDRHMDGETDRRTEFSSLDRVCIPCSAGKNDENENKLANLITICCNCFQPSTYQITCDTNQTHCSNTHTYIHTYIH